MYKYSASPIGVVTYNTERKEGAISENILEQRSVLQERVNMLKTNGYRGFRIMKGSQKPEYSFEVSASNSKGLRLIAVGDTLDEAYENLIERIDFTFDS